MRRPSRWLRVLALIAAAPAFAFVAAARDRDEVPRYLFSYFTGNGEDGLHLAASADGLTWTALNDGASFLQPTVGTKLMRDPSIVRGLDGVFHMVWTTGWWDRGIGLAHSKDLVTWSEQEWIPVMQHEPTALNAWAPEIFYDDEAGEYQVFWASTIPGRFPETEESGDLREDGKKLNHRMYFTATKDFRSWTPTALFYDDGFNVIDATIVKGNGEYVMVLKDETKRPEAKKNLRVARAKHARGPYGPASPPISVDWVEGPTVLRVGKDWIVYYDEYTRKRYGAMRSSDLREWTVISDHLRFPPGARHGTAIPVETSLIGELQALRPPR